MGYMLKALVQLWPLLKEVFVKDNSKDAQSKKLALLIVTVLSFLLFVADSRSLEAWLGKSIVDANKKATKETMCTDQRLLGYLEEHIQDLIRNRDSLIADRDELRIELDILQQKFDALLKENTRAPIEDSQTVPKSRKPFDSSSTPPSADAWHKYQELYNDS